MFYHILFIIKALDFFQEFKLCILVNLNAYNILLNIENSMKHDYGS